jgi:hypothetical protein
MIKSRWFNNEMIQAFPLAHLMRETFPEHWIRIHSLPESKRYPETEAEKEIIFDRYSLFGTALLGHGASCLIIQSRFLGFPRLDEFMPEFSWQQIHQVGKDEDDTWNSWQAPITWTPKEMRPLLLAIAEDKEAHIAFLSNITDCVFIPSDGGADGFSFDSKLLQRLLEEFSPWSSNHPRGL